jgi:hypothetical protein
VFDLGRSECGNRGLITFKDRWGAKRSLLTYSRFLNSARTKRAFLGPGVDWKEQTAKKVLPYLPDRIIDAVANVMCKHLG